MATGQDSEPKVVSAKLPADRAAEFEDWKEQHGLDNQSEAVRRALTRGIHLPPPEEVEELREQAARANDSLAADILRYGAVLSLPGATAAYIFAVVTQSPPLLRFAVALFIATIVCGLGYMAWTGWADVELTIVERLQQRGGGRG